MHGVLEVLMVLPLLLLLLTSILLTSAGGVMRLHDVVIVDDLMGVEVGGNFHFNYFNF